MTRTLHVEEERWPLAVPFQITGHRWDNLNAIKVSISQDRHTGTGEAAGVYYRGDTPEKMLEQINSVRDAIEAGATRDALLSLLPCGGARNALDCALWDLEAKLANRSVTDLLGLELKPLTTVFTISIREDVEEMAEVARRYHSFPVLKVKLDGELPVERMEAIRQVRPDATLVIDANQGFSFDLLKEVMPAFERLGIAMVEQPMARGEDEELEGYRAPIPLCADESILDRSELDAAARRYQMINIKLDKTGGLTEALALQNEAHTRGLHTMVGNMFGTSLAMAPAFLIGQGCKFVDLDGPLHLKEDRNPSFRFKDSEMSEFPAALWGGG